MHNWMDIEGTRTGRGINIPSLSINPVTVTRDTEVIIRIAALVPIISNARQFRHQWMVSMLGCLFSKLSTEEVCYDLQVEYFLMCPNLNLTNCL